MGLIINIDEALKQRTEYNVLKEPLNKLLMDSQEAWEKKNPIDLLFFRNTLSSFQETYTSSIGFDHAFAETADYSVGPIFNTEEGFSATYRSRTFQGGFIITQQTLEDGRVGVVKDNANAFMRRWHGDTVEYAMAAIASGFGYEVEWGSVANGGVSRLKLTSADTIDGELGSAKNPLFSKSHTIVKRRGMTANDITNALQSNKFHCKIELGGSDPGQLAKLSDLIYQVVSAMENYKDDNNKYAGVQGAKVIVAPNDPRLKAALEAVLSMMSYGDTPNTAYKIATLETTPYLRDIAPCANGQGFFIVDPAYNKANHGPEFTERIPLTLDVENSKKPKGVEYSGRQRFDINCASWRGISYVNIGTLDNNDGKWNSSGTFTEITAVATLVKPVSVVGTVATEEQN